MPGINIEQIFTAESQSVFDLLTVDGQGCYVPAYQRPYAWDTENVHRLLEDATLGFAKLAENDDSIRFLGTVIAIYGVTLADVQAPFDRELPTRILTIIDGQQRLCTLILLNVILHDALRALTRELEDDEEEEAVRWLKEDIDDFLDELAKTFRFVGRRARAGDRHDWYPRIIRAYDDRWGRTAAAARYQSPIARFIWEYLEHLADEEVGRFEYEPTDDDDEVPEDHEPVLDVIAYIRQVTDGLAEGPYENLALPAAAEIIDNPNLHSGLWPNALPAHLGVFLRDGTEHDLHGAFERAVRLAAFARYLNQGMAVTVVLTQAEDHAFDMFESLNTTGQPLTAFETFKPKVLEAEGANFQGSTSQSALEKVQAYLDRFKRADERQNAASTLMIPFALVEEGHKLEKHLSAQRRYLRDAYARAPDIASKRNFTTSLSTTAQFVSSVWRPRRRQEPKLLPRDQPVDQVAELCIEVLRDIRHDVAIAPIARFYGAYSSARVQVRAAAAQEYFAAIKAITAFSMIWRAGFGGTASIDTVYRDIMRRGAGGAAALSRESGQAPTASALRGMLRHYLTDEEFDRETWARNASQIPIYRVGQAVTRFLLFAASHDAMPDEDAPGLIQPGRAGTNPMLTRLHWHDETNISVEHVAPDSPSAGWPGDVYDDARTVQRLGNFILVPKVENNLLANRPWAQKRVLYSLFSSRTAREAQRAITAAARDGFNVGRTAQDLVSTSRFLPMCEAVAAYEGEWDEPFIALRGTHLAGLAWDRLWTWLEEPRAPRPRPRRRG